MNTLDAVDKMKALDPSGMYDKIYHFPEQLEKALAIGKGINPELGHYRDIKNIIVAGMGGSAIGGDLVRSYLAGTIKIPFHVCRHYRLPEFVDRDSLVVVSSYSGNTEETLSALSDAMSRGARVACISSGGKVADIARANNFLLVELPKGFPPRAALGFSFVPLLMLVSRLKLIGEVENDISELILGLKAYRDRFADDTSAENNPAKTLALRLYKKIPIIYSGPELTDAVGTRWKGQICENAKCLAFNNQFAEFNHNELVGWNVIEAYRDRIIVIYLRDNDDHPRITRRMEIVRTIIEKLNVDVVDIFSHGDFALGRIFSLIQLGDFTSFYLAVLNNVDPTPVKVIDFLKGELEK
ncbi:MAG: bifunctional phosphoglucose/phosphomannose isomerase [candidate division Zixibacteria bacterium]|nr:bifunctional phosphoglucose/phosphomannose isomerase [candidate division Zixibacteria bacterium]